MEPQKISAYIDSLIEKARSISRDIDFDIVHTSTMSLMSRIYGQNSHQVTDLGYMSYSAPFDGRGPGNLGRIKEKITALLESTNREIEVFGLDTKEIVNPQGFNINIAQSQSQEIIINLSAFKEELSPEQVTEVQALIDAKDLSPVEKKSHLKETLKRFGVDALSGVISGILTNPAMLG